MSYITAAEANAWADHTKLDLTSVDGDLESAVASQIFARVSKAYDTSGWTDQTNTPSLIRKLIAMMYVAWYYLRTYSEEEDISNYGMLLQGQVDNLIVGIVDGSVILPEVVVPGTVQLGAPEFYPNDASSAQTPTVDDPSLGPAKFSMGQVW